MQSGKLDKRISIYQKTQTRDSFGAEVIDWRPLCAVWATVSVLSGREFLEGKQMEEERTTRVRIRYRADVTPSMQVWWRDRKYDITDVQHDYERETLLMCRELISEVIPDDA